MKELDNVAAVTDWRRIERLFHNIHTESRAGQLAWPPLMMFKVIPPMKNKIRAISVLMMLSLVIACGGRKGIDDVPYSVQSMSISSDATQALLLYCDRKYMQRVIGHQCGTALYDIKKKRFVGIYRAAQNDFKIRWATFSADNQRIAFSAQYQDYDWPLAIMQADGSGMRILTERRKGTVALRPSFSNRGDKLIYAMTSDTYYNYSAKEKKRASSWVSWPSYHEIAIDGSGYRRLTPFKMYVYGRPRYLPNDQDFIFNGEVLRAIDRKSSWVAEEERLKKGAGSNRLFSFTAYRNLYGDNNIFIMGPNAGYRYAPAMPDLPVKFHYNRYPEFIDDYRFLFSASGDDFIDQIVVYDRRAQQARRLRMIGDEFGVDDINALTNSKRRKMRLWRYFHLDYAHQANAMGYVLSNLVTREAHLKVMALDGYAVTDAGLYEARKKMNAGEYTPKIIIVGE